MSHILLRNWKLGMNKLCVVGRNFETPFIKRLSEEVGSLKWTPFNPWLEMALPWADLYLVRSPGVYRDDWDLIQLERIGEKSGIINPLTALKLFRDKVGQFSFWQGKGISVLPWLDLRQSDLSQALAFFDQQQMSVGLVKPTRGQQGWGVEKCDKDQFAKWWVAQQQKGDRDYLLQPFIKARELRVFYIQQKIWVLERTPLQGVVANFAQQGGASLTQLSSSAASFIKSIIELSGTHYGAIDFFMVNGQPILLELNLSPGIEQLEQLTGENIMNQLLRSIKIIT